MRVAAAPGHKVCARCKVELPHESFMKNSARWDGRHHYCKPCAAAYAKEKRYSTSPATRERNLRARRKYYAKTGARQREYARKLRMNYGLDERAYEEIFEAQGRRCAICQSSDFGSRGPHVDHCHSTGVVRGILCRGCNHGLGNFKDDSERMRNAIAYLESCLGRLLKVAA